MNGKFFRLFLLSVISTALLFACRSTKYVPEGESLLEKNRFKVSNGKIKPSEVEPYVRQRPNKRIFGARFHLALYNMSNINKKKGLNKWLRDIGEEPVIFDSYETDRSARQIESFAFNKGYFDVAVVDTVVTEKQRSTVTYNVNITTPYRVRDINYEIADTNLNKLYVIDTAYCLIKRGDPYDNDLLQQERQRVERFVRDHGFYRFSSDYISFDIDSAVGNRQVDIKFIVKNVSVTDENKRVYTVPHSIYRVSNIYIYTDFNPREAIENGDSYFSSFDTVFYRGFYFITSRMKPAVKRDFIIQSLYLVPGSIYNQTNIELSQSRLMSSHVYRLVNINFTGADNSRYGSGELFKTIDCVIQLTLLPQQSYKVELEGTHSGGNLGGGLNLVYQHKNLFRGAEQFTLKLKGAYEGMWQDRHEKQQQYNQIHEYGAEMGFRFPAFIIPFFKNEKIVRRYNPTTNVIASYNYQNMPFYARTMANMSFGYNWKSGKYIEHYVNPLQFNIVKLDRIDPNFANQINSSSYLAYAYRDVLILGGNYSYIYNSQLIKDARYYWFARWNVEAAGNMLRAYDMVANPDKQDVVYEFLNQPFAQYVKTDLDIRYNYVMNPAASMVYRGFLGVAVPYGNSKAIPFERQYFGGGSNGIRGWQVRTLGPGSSVPDTSATFLNQTADIKIELNMEYRFKLFWVLEGAMFADAGNIWTYKHDYDREGAQFKFDKFYKDIAVGGGLGLRFDFTFFLGRLDFGMKLRDPAIQGTDKWIFSNRPYTWRDFTTVIAIGYPF